MRVSEPSLSIRSLLLGLPVLLLGVDALAQVPERSSQAASNVSIPAILEPYNYEPRGRRDPFMQPIEDKPVEQGSSHGPLLPLQKYELRQLRLIGIIWDVRKPKAMIQDPGGQTHIVGPNAKLGPRNGYIASIREGEIVVVETIEEDGRLNSTAQVVKIAK